MRKSSDLRNSGFEVPAKFQTDVEDAIKGTVFLEEPSTEYGKFLSDADVWSFGAEWEEFYSKTVDVKEEIAPHVPIEEWMSYRGFLLQQHSYYTESGVSLYRGQKRKNISRIEDKYGIIETPPIEF